MILRVIKQPIIWLLVVLSVALFFVSKQGHTPTPRNVTLHSFETAVEGHQVDDVKISSSGGSLKASVTDGGHQQLVAVNLLRGDGTRILEELKANNVNYDIVADKSSLLGPVFIQVILPMFLIFGLMMIVLNKIAPGGGGISKFGKARVKTVEKDQPQTTFADVAGASEAVADLQEIKDFLASPTKFHKFGAKIPKGVLLYGPPGTGKTLLARAVAGEAGVPFFSISGSDFVEMFVGVGASRVRDLFDQAKAAAPAIIFVDEIDAVGRHRGSGMGGGHDEREQTLNQLLVEMDGFDARTGVILIAATNRPDILDPALLRPGRFDRQVVVDNPDLEGRKAILAVHAKDKPLENVDLAVIARRTPGFTGADLANILNEAALLSARRDSEQISMHDMEEAIDRVIAGPEKHTRAMSDHEKRVIAYHEAGHALAGHLMPESDPVHKISIVARGRALGWTLSLPTEDKYMHSRRELLARLAGLMGGRTSEEIVFGEITTGASDDIQKATELARAMVTEYGMSDVIGPMRLGEKSSDGYLGRNGGGDSNYSDEVARRLDGEVSKIIDDAHQTARDILTTYRENLERVANWLIEHESVNQEKFLELVGDVPKWQPAYERDPKSPVPSGA